MKPWYLSKMVMVNVLAGLVMILAQFPQLAVVADFLKVHFAEAGLGWAVLNAGLRFISHDKVTLS